MYQKEDKERNIEVIDVTNISRKVIFNKDKKVVKEKSAWDKGFKLPVANRFTSKSQVYEEALKMYNILCDSLNDYLLKQNSSLNNEIIRIHHDGGFYNDILKTMQYIAEGHVSKVYRGAHNYYGLEYSYKLLEKHFDVNLREYIFNLAQQLETEIAPANGKTIKHFNLLDNGYAYRWWDKKGLVRSERIFSKEENNILDATPARDTVVWYYPTMNKEIVLLYMRLWKLIIDSLDSDDWDLDRRIKIKKIINGNYMYYEDYGNGKLLAGLLKICENTLRRSVKTLQVLNDDEDFASIEDFLPMSVKDSIYNAISDYLYTISNEQIVQILDDIIEYNAKDHKSKLERIMLSNQNDMIELLVKYEQDQHFDKLLKTLIRLNINEDITLAALFALDRDEILTKKNLNLLSKLVHPTNEKNYAELLSLTDELSLEILNKLIKMRLPVVREIKLNTDKLKKSQEKLADTVNIIEAYIGEVNEVDNQSNKVVVETVKEIEYKKFDDLIYQLIEQDLAIEVVEAIAQSENKLLNKYLSDINQSLYEYFEDQVIILESEEVKIDDFYKDLVKELVENEK